MLSRKIPKLKLWSRLGLKCKGSSNTRDSIGNTSSNSNMVVTSKTTSFYKAFSIRSREFGKYALQGIPVLSIFALVGIVGYTIGITSFNRSTDSKQKAYAAESTTSTTSGTSSSASASLVVDNNTFYDNIDAEYGTTNYASHKVTISADNIDGYTLTITGPTNLTAPNGNNATTSDVTKWGYAWGAENATEANLDYNNFTGTTQNLETNTGITNNSVNLTKKLAFAATFTNNASDGHYTGTVGLGLTVVPSVLVSWENLIYMQDMNSATCGSVSIGTEKLLKDSRDDNYYTVSKLIDENCWMTQNLRLAGGSSVNRTNTDLDKSVYTTDTQSYTLPASSSGGFSSNDTARQMRNSENSDYGAYYSWCAVTANTCQVGGTPISTDSDASSSICPKGWKLPSGGPDGDLQFLYNKWTTALWGVNLGINGRWLGAASKAIGGAFFPAAGRVGTSGLSDPGKEGMYWSRTANGTNYAYYLSFDSSSINPASGYSRYRGFPVRCVVYSE